MIGGTLVTRRNILWLGAGFAASARMSGVGWSAEGKVLTIRAQRDIQVLDPGWMIGDTEIDLQYACLGSLVVYQPGDPLTWRPSPFVNKIEQTDDLHIAFELKPGIQWSNGFGEMTAEDVKYSFERIADPKNEAPWKDKWGSLQEVTVTGPLSGVIVLKEAFSPLWLTTLCDGAGSIVCKKAVEAKGGKFTTEFPAICGPYLIKRWIPKQSIELARNPLWQGEKPDFDAVNIVFIEDPKIGEAAYEAGDVDLTLISFDSLARYKAELPQHTKLYEGGGLWWTWMGMNTEHPKLQDIRVRKAIQNSVDLDAIIQAAYGGVEATRARGVVPRGLIGYRTKSAFEKPDLDAARALLKEAGIQDLVLNIKVLNSSPFVTIAQIIQANLAEIGITLEIDQLDSGPYWNLGLETKGDAWKDLQLWIMRFGDTPDPSQMTQWYISSQVGVWNWERWKNAEFDELNKKGLSETDPEKRSAIYVRMQDIMEETGAYVWIAHEPVLIMYRDSIAPAILPPSHPYFPDFKAV